MSGTEGEFRESLCFHGLMLIAEASDRVYSKYKKWIDDKRRNGGEAFFDSDTAKDFADTYL